MRQASGAGKAAPRFHYHKRLIAGALLLFVQACSTLGGKGQADIVANQGEELRLAQARAVELQSEIARLSVENDALEAKVADLEKQAERLAMLESPAASETDAVPLKEGRPAAAPAEKRPSTAPAAPIVAAPNADASAPRGPVPIDNSPRLVQPSFASSEQIFENEAANPEIKMTSVLWGVHLASYKHADDAADGWNKLQRENPDELGLLEPRIEKVTVEGKGEYLRLVGGGFSSREKAKALCDTLGTKGVFCRVAVFGGDKLSMLEPGQLR